MDSLYPSPDLNFKLMDLRTSTAASEADRPWAMGSYLCKYVQSEVHHKVVSNNRAHFRAFAAKRIFYYQENA